MAYALNALVRVMCNGTESGLANRLEMAAELAQQGRPGGGAVWLLSKFQVFMESGHIPPKLELEGEGRGERPVSERILSKSPPSSIQPFPTLVTRPSNQSDYDDNDDDDDDYDDDDYDPSTPVFPFFPTLVSRPSNQSNLRVRVIIAPHLYTFLY